MIIKHILATDLRAYNCAAIAGSKPEQHHRADEVEVQTDPPIDALPRVPRLIVRVQLGGA